MSHKDEVYHIHWCEPKNFEGVFQINKQSNLFASAQFVTSPFTIRKTLDSRQIFLVAESDKGDCVGYILAKMKVPGVCFNELLGVDTAHRRRGLGGALITSVLKCLSYGIADSNPFWSWKWNASVPAYNVEALQMYKVLRFEIEGLLKRHTKNKTDLYLISFFLDEADKKPIPTLGGHVHDPAIITDHGLLDNFQKKIDSWKQMTRPMFPSEEKLAFTELNVST